MLGYNVVWSDEDLEWVATCSRYKYLSYLADDPVEALRGLVQILEESDHDGEGVPATAGA